MGRRLTFLDSGLAVSDAAGLDAKFSHDWKSLAACSVLHSRVGKANRRISRRTTLHRSDGRSRCG